MTSRHFFTPSAKHTIIHRTGSTPQLERSRLRSWHPRVVWIYIKRWFQRGAFYDSHGDDTSQLGGDFIVDKNGILRLVHPSHDPADRPSVEELVKVLKDLYN